MPEPDIPTVSSGQVIASSWGNTVRTKVQDTTDGHKHDGAGSKLLDQGSARIFSGLAANKGAAGTAGRLYFETDTKILQYDNGSAWVEILRGETAIRLAQLSEKSHANLTSVTEDQHHTKVHGLTEHNEGSAKITGGLDAAKPAAGTPWRMYWATDTGILYLDNGTAWVEILRAEAATRLAQIAEKSHGSLANVTSDQHHARSHDHANALDGSPIAVAGVPNLPASKITSERFGMPRMPDGILNYVIKGAGAGVDPAYGQVAHGELTGVTSDQHHARLHDHSLAADGSPIAVAGVPDLPASKITSEILAAARGGLAKVLSPTWTNDFILVYKTATDQWVMEAKPAGADHNLLSATHLDTLAGSVVAGDIIIGNATPKWARLPKGTNGQVLTLVSNLPTWADPSAADPEATFFGSKQIHVLEPNNFEGSSGTGADSKDGLACRFYTGALVNDVRQISARWERWAAANDPNIFNRNPQFGCFIMLESIAAQNVWVMFGYRADDFYATKGFGIKIINNALYTISNDGTTESTLDLATALSASTWYKIRVKLVSATNIRVWVNGVEKTPKTTNLPSGQTTIGGACLAYRAQTTEAVAKYMHFKSTIFMFDF